MSGNVDKRKLVTVAWRKCCVKTSEGGLGIIFLKQFNIATNTHHCWKFLNNNRDWSKLLNARVKKKGNMIKYSIKSSLWKGLKEVHDFVLNHRTWTIGNGKSINFWRDSWAGEVLVEKFKIPLQFHSSLIKPLADFWKDNAWHIHDNITQALPSLLPYISTFVVANSHMDDFLAWKDAEDDVLSIKVAYSMNQVSLVSSI